MVKTGMLVPVELLIIAPNLSSICHVYKSFAIGYCVSVTILLLITNGAHDEYIVDTKSALGLGQTVTFVLAESIHPCFEVAINLIL